MSNAVVSAFKNKQLRKKLLFTTLILIVVRFGSQLPIPEIDSAQISAYLKSTLGDSFNLLNSFTGGSFMQMSVFALSVTPYITSSIIMQLMTIVIPALEEMQKDLLALPALWIRIYGDPQRDLYRVGRFFRQHLYDERCGGGIRDHTNGSCVCLGRFNCDI